MEASLAINGGKPVFTGTFPAWPQWDEAERANLMRVLEARQWGTLGKAALAFAARFAGVIGAKHAIAMNSGTQALQILLQGAGIGHGDEVVLPGVAPASPLAAVATVGATPVFADVTENDACLVPSAAEAAVTARTRAILAIHLAGRPCDMAALARIASARGLRLFEDCAQAHGAVYEGRCAGTLADGAVFDFGVASNLTCGEGGLVATNTEALYEACWPLHTSGRALKGSSEFGGKVLMGSNGRMAEWEAAVLDAQLDRFAEQQARRSRNAIALRAALRAIPGVVAPADDPRIDAQSCSVFLARIDDERLTCDREAFIRALVAEGVPAERGFQPLHRQGLLASEGFRKATGSTFDYAALRLPDAERWSETAVVLPGRLLLGDAGHVGAIVEAFQKVAGAYAR